MAIAALQLVAAACPAAAQRTGSHIGREANSGDAEAALRIIVDCLVKRHPRVADRWLATIPGTPAEKTVIDGVVPDLGLCMSNSQLLILESKEVQLKPGVLRRPMAYARALRALGRPHQPPTGISPDEPWFMPALGAISQGTNIDRTALALQEFGHCVAVTDWAATSAFMLSVPGSPAERAAINRLVPALGPCLTENLSVTVTPANLRAVLAEPVYHLLADSTGAASPPAPRNQGNQDD